MVASGVARGAAAEPVEGTRTLVIVPRGELAYVGQSGGLVIRDVSDPLRPRDIGWLALPATVLDVALDGAHALLAAGTRGLVVADISNPEEPRELARLDTDGKAKRVAWDGERAFVADGINGLLVIDVSAIEAPRIVARVSTGGDVRATALRGESLAIAEAQGGVRVFSVRQPDNPRETRRLETAFAARDLCWLGDHLYVAAGSAGVAVYQPRISGRPTAFLPPLRSAQHVACGEGLVAVSDMGSAIQLFAAGEDGTLTQRAGARVHRTAPIGRAQLDGKRLWIAVDIGGMGLFDLSDPGAPVLVLPRRREFKLKD